MDRQHLKAAARLASFGGLLCWALCQGLYKPWLIFLHNNLIRRVLLFPFKMKTTQNKKLPSLILSDYKNNACMLTHSLGRVLLFVTPMGCQSTRLLCSWNFPGKNTGVGCHFLLQGIFLTQGSKVIHGHLNIQIYGNISREHQSLYSFPPSEKLPRCFSHFLLCRFPLVEVVPAAGWAQR